MAKGNDGNYLQHSVEVALAVQLLAATAQRRLHLALTHGMAPFEPCDRPPNGQTRRLLHGALQAAQQPATTLDEPAIAAAYRATNASLAAYPNTGELIAAMIGRDRLSGGITEVDAQKHEQLQHTWSDSRVTPVRASWRSQTSLGGVHFCPRDFTSPWLFSADPMTYREDQERDDDKLYRADRLRLSEALSTFIASGVPGMATLFVYGVKPDVRPQFWAFVDDIAADLEVSIESCWVPHQGGNRNLAAILSSRAILPPNWLPRGLIPGR